MKTTNILTLLLLPLTLLADGFQRSAVESEMTPEGARIDRFTIYSPSMQRDIKAAVVLPPAYLKDDGATYPILYTLHGHAAPYDTWANMSKLRRQLNKTPFIVTCFDGDNGSQYVDAFNPLDITRGKKDDEAYQPNLQASRFQTFFFEEFIPAIDEWYRVNPDKRGVTGFSMGGAGALGYALERPEMFTAVSGLSSTYRDFSDPDSKYVEWMVPALGPMDEYPERYDALSHYKTIERLIAEGTPLPPIYEHVGLDDRFVEANRKFRDFAKEQGVHLTYVESQGGHDWKFWHPASIGIAEFHWRHFQD